MPEQTPNSASPLVMMTITEIAKRDGVSKPTVSVAVKKLIDAHGLFVERDARDRVAKVNVAQYDHLREKFGNAIRAQAPDMPTGQLPLETPSPTGGETKVADSLEEAQRKRAWIETERSAMRFAEERGDLVRVNGVIESLRECGGKIAQIVDRLQHAADDLAAAAARDGTHGLRVALKIISQQMRDDIATALAAVATDSPETEASRQQTEHAPAAG